MDVQKVNEIILAEMMVDGWYDYNAPEHPYCFREPEPHDINNGNCEDWALKARELFGGEIVWLDTFASCRDWAHCVLRLNGRYYDSVHPEGARSLREFKQITKDYFNRRRRRDEAN